MTRTGTDSGRQASNALPWSAEAFEQRYSANPDPWQFATSAYEHARYRLTLQALCRRHYAAVFEPGCSIGILTEQLARRADTVIATDVAPSAVRAAQRRCAHLPHVHIRCERLCAATLSSEPCGPFDLIVLSELGYYFSATDLATLAQALAARLTDDGELIAVHWLGHSADHQLHGDEVHEVLAEALPLERMSGIRTPGFRIDSWMANDRA